MLSAACDIVLSHPVRMIWELYNALCATSHGKVYDGYMYALVLQTSSPKGNDRSPDYKQVFLNSSLVSKRFFSIGQGQPTLQSMVDQILNTIKGCYSVANLQKKMTL